MSTLKNKTKEFVKENKKELCIAAGAAVVGAAFGFNKGKNKGLDIGINVGVWAGFEAGIDWFDKTFDNLNLRELYVNWAKEHPEEMVKAFQ